MAGRERFFLLWIFCIGCHFTIFGQDSIQGNTYAVVVGIAQYQNPNMPSLQFADKDARLFAAYLQTKAGGNVPVSNIKLLTNETATIAAIYDALNWLQERCTANDKAYFYFSGHGDVETNSKSNLGYLLAYNSPLNNYRNNAITIEDLNKVANHLSVQSRSTVVLVTDACHSGKLAGDYYKGNQLVASQLRLILNNEVRLAACAVDEKASEGEDWGGGRGVFSYYLLKGLNGMADLNRNDTIQLGELNTYLDSALAADKVLIRNARKQHPALDGNPYQTMAVVDNSALKSFNTLSSDSKPADPLKSVLSIFKPLGKQPIDYVFQLMKTKSIESKLHFSAYANVPTDSLSLKIVNDCITYQQQLNKQIDSLKLINQYVDSSYLFADTDTLQLLKNQLLNNKVVVSTFNEKFIQIVHGKAQDMVNAYLEGDLDELEKRQYYYAGNGQYSDFIFMLRIALKITPEQHYLSNLLKVQEAYIGGLVTRLEMATSQNTQILLTRAINYQQKASKLESFAAFVHNEMGNLYIHNKKYALAEQQFNIANELSPTWAIPWSNKIRLGLVTGNLKNAVLAVKKADSLQHDLSYTFINAGLVMAKHGDLLAAESYYQKAIRTNIKHFLPYESLGKLYIRTGDYYKADSFLTEASIRKKGFAINMDFFADGPDAIERAPSPFGKWYECELYRNVQSKKLKHYIRLLNAFQLIESEPDSALQMMKDASKQSGDLPLLKHYIAKVLFDRQKWEKAEPFLLQAIQSYKSDSAFSAFLESDLTAKSEADTCLLVSLMQYQYDILEDHYRLAAVYEHLGAAQKVFEQYAIITDIENEKQKDQAAFRGFYALPGKKPRFLSLEDRSGVDELRYKYETPPRMGGYLKMAVIYEKSGDYLAAERVYQKQLELNREAGNIRYAQADRGPFHFEGSNTYYRIAASRLTEAATFDFYQRMLRLFPRDTEWQEKSGMFLYNRLLPIFRKVPADQYYSAYEVIKEYAYPFLNSNKRNTHSLGEEQRFLDVQFYLPGTEELVIIPTPKYDPLKESIESLKLAVRLSGEVKTKPELLRAIANLSSWMDNRKEAFEQYKELIFVQKPDAQLRSEIIDYCFLINESSFAMDQLGILNQLGQTTPSQDMRLVDSYALSNLPERALLILKNIKTDNETDRVKATMLNAKINWLAGRKADALENLNSVTMEVIKKTDPDSTKKIAADRYYSIARLNAAMKKGNNAFAALHAALENGFTYRYVLDSDTAWNRLRKSQRWKKLMQEYAGQLNASVIRKKGKDDRFEIREKIIAD